MSRIAIVAVAVIMSGAAMTALGYRDGQLISAALSQVAASDMAARAAEDHDDAVALAAYELAKTFRRLTEEADRCRI